ncbi:MAG: ATP-binding protein [Gaiellaceae bacterium]
MRNLPTGTVTFLFTDIEGSTRLLRELGNAYAAVLADHRRLLRDAFARHGGVEVDTQGDAFFVAFSRAQEAVAAADEVQSALKTGSARVRIGIHTGEPLVTDEGYVGPDVHRAARIMSAGHGGQTVISQTTRELLDEAFSLSDLGVHRLKDLSAPEHLYQLGEEAFAPLKTLYHTNLPIPATPFLGRERELSDLMALVAREDLRLLTLTGPGGTGKTRLALQVASDLSESYEHGVWWVPLAPLRDPPLVIETAAQVLGAKRELAKHIRDKRLLLLLDNFEHLVEAASSVAELLRACPRLDVLVTSRELLQVADEHVYVVPPLTTEEAIDLFTVRAASKGVEVVQSQSIAALCARLDNLPLALELAAARTRFLTLEQLLERLSQRLDLLKGGRDLDARQHTLRATIAWSYDLLTPAEQCLFARLGVFAGGCTLGAAEDICEAQLDTLASLVDKSLVRRSAARFWMLETIREFARERLLESGEEEDLARRHGAWFLDLAERASPELHAHKASDWLELLEDEHDNLRAVLDRALADGEAEVALRLTGAIWTFWFTRGYWSEARRRFDAALESGAGAHPEHKVDPLWGSAVMALLQGDSETSAARATQLLSLSRQHGIKRGIAIASEQLAMHADDADDLLEATRLYERAESLAREMGDRFLLSLVLNNFGDMLIRQHDFRGAALRFEESLEIARARGDRERVAGELAALGFVALGLGEPAPARPLFRESLEAAGAVGSRQGFLFALLGLGIALADDDPLQASRLLGSADAVLEEVGASSYLGFEEELRTRTVEALRCSLGEDGWATAYAEGRALSVHDALDEALSAG